MPRPKKKQVLFEDDVSSANMNAGVRAPALVVNRRFAQRYEEKKRAQELSRARELGLDTVQEPTTSDEESEDEGEALTPNVDRQIRRTIELIRKRDPIVYDAKVSFFERPAANSDETGPSGEYAAVETLDSSILVSTTEEETALQQKRKKKPKPETAKDVLRRQLVDAAERGETDAFVDDDADGVGLKRRRAPLGDEDGHRPAVYDEEQAELRRAFLESAAATAADRATSALLDDGGDEGDELLHVKSKVAGRRDSGQRDGRVTTGGDDDGDASSVEREQLRAHLRTRSGAIAEHAMEIADPERFLDAFARSHAWRDESDDDVPVIDDDDEEAVAAADSFEASYNFRFEDPAGAEIITYGRTIEGSLRRVDNKRKEERAARKARKAEERLEAEAQARRLTNLRRAEIKAQVARVRAIAGNGVEKGAVAAALAAGVTGGGDEWDPAAHDAAMARLFGDEYYAAPELEATVDVDSGDSGGDDGSDASNDDDDERVPGWVFGDGPRPLWAGPPAEVLAAGGEDDLGGGAPGGEEDAEADVGAVEKSDEESAIQRARGGRRAHRSKAKLSEVARARAEVAADEEAAAADPDSVLALGFEDVIAGGLRTRFNYVRVPPADYGLTADDILLADDGALNKYVGLRRLAPFRDSEWTVPSKIRRRAVSELRKSIAEKIGGNKDDMQAPVGDIHVPTGGESVNIDRTDNEQERDSAVPGGDDAELHMAARHKRRRRRHGQNNDTGDSSTRDAVAPVAYEAEAPRPPASTGGADDYASHAARKKERKRRRAESASAASQEPRSQHVGADDVVTLPTGVAMSKRRLATYGL